MLPIQWLKKSVQKAAALVSLALLLNACANHYQPNEENSPDLPQTWQTVVDTGLASWSQFIQVPELEQLLVAALAQNPNIKRKALDVEIARSNLFQKKMQFWPALDFRFTGNRSGVQLEGSPINNNFVLGANLSYELNLWGQLGDDKKAAGFAFSAAQAELEMSRRALVNSLANAWLDTLASQRFVDLSESRLATLEKNLAIIESGYRGGLNKALEVYLTRNDVEAERSRLVQQRQTLSDARRNLELLLGAYPDNQRQVINQFPVTEPVLPPALPSELLLQRPDIQAAWFRLLQQNSTLAVAHKARFPALTLTTSVNKQTDDISALGASNLAWTVGGSLIQPLINAGRLKANENIAFLQLQKVEHTYLETVYAAFQQVESALEKQEKFNEQLRFTQDSAENAMQAESLSFEQYQRGIVNYSTVLESQRRHLDAQTQLITLQKQIIANRIALFNAVNGSLDFLPRAQNTNL